MPLHPSDDIALNFVFELIETMYPLNYAAFLEGADIIDPQSN